MSADSTLLSVVTVLNWIPGNTIESVAASMFVYKRLQLTRGKVRSKSTVVSVYRTLSAHSDSTRSTVLSQMLRHVCVCVHVQQLMYCLTLYCRHLQLVFQSVFSNLLSCSCSYSRLQCTPLSMCSHSVLLS